MKEVKAYLLTGSKFVVYLMIGIPGSGKSTWAKSTFPKLPIISRDIIRAKLGFTRDSDEKAVLSAVQEKQVTEEEHFLINKYAKKNQSFIIDDTNTGRFRKGLIQTLKDLGATVVGINIDTPLEICINRRAGQIPEYVMRRLYEQQIPITRDEVDDLFVVKGY